MDRGFERRWNARKKSEQILKEEQTEFSNYMHWYRKTYPDDTNVDTIRKIRKSLMPLTTAIGEENRKRFNEYCQYVLENAPKTIMKEISALKDSNFELRLKEILGVTVSKENEEQHIINEDYIRLLPCFVLDSYENFITCTLEYFMQCAMMNMSPPFKYEVKVSLFSLPGENFFEIPIKDEYRDKFSHTESAPEFISILKEIFQFLLPSFNIELIFYCKPVYKYKLEVTGGSFNGGHHMDWVPHLYDYIYFFRATLS